MSEFRRLHPATLVFRFVGAVQAFFVPALLVWLWADDDQRWELWLAWLFVPVCVAHVLHYLSFRYALREDELVLRSGIVFRRERHVPYERIENVDLTRNPAHRFFGVGDVRLDTASGEAVEASFKVLSMRSVTEILAAIRDRAGPGSAAVGAAAHLEAIEAQGAATEAEPANASTALHRLTTRDLVLLGATSGRGLIALAALLGVLWRFDIPEKLLADSFVEPFVERVFDATREASFLWALCLVACLVAGLVSLSIAWTYFRYARYRLDIEDAQFRWRAGAWTERRVAIPRERVQRLTLRQSLVQRLSGWASLRIETAGARVESEERAGRNDFVPLCRWHDVERLLSSVLPGCELPAHVDRPHAAATRRVTRRACVEGALFAGLGFFVFDVLVASIVGLSFVLAWVLRSRRDMQFRGHALARGYLVARRGFPGRVWIFVPLSKVQVVSLWCSPFDRRWGMATLGVDVAGARECLTLPYLASADAKSLRDALAHAQLGTATTSEVRDREGNSRHVDATPVAHREEIGIEGIVDEER